MRAPASKPTLIEKLSVERWFSLVGAVLLVLVVAGSALGAYLLAQTRAASDELLTRLQPAAAEAYRMQSGLVEQQTGIRGYAITVDQRFLEPYHRGRQQESQSAQRIRELLADRPELGDELTAVESQANRWREMFAEPILANGQPSAATELAAGQALFDDVRAASEQQNRGLDAAIDHERVHLGEIRALRDGVLAALVLAFLITGALAALLIRRLIVRPLRALQTSSLRVAGGDFAHRLEARGPADLMTLAEAIEAMRRRIVTELDASHAQRDALSRQAIEKDEQAVELRRSNAELEQFAYVASHDLQEPLRKVASFTQLLEKRYGDQLDDRARQYISFAVDGARRMQVLINDLLTFSRVGRLTDHVAEFDIDQTLDKALANLATTIEESGARIERPDQLPRIVGDATLWTMLWQNLIANAIKFRHGDRTPEVRIDCERSRRDDTDNWLIRVTDNGIGIPTEFSEKVFVIFQRLHGRDEYGGTGIGLALCKKIVEFHGGKIWIDTTMTEGTSFCLTVPANSEAPTPTRLQGVSV